MLCYVGIPTNYFTDLKFKCYIIYYYNKWTKIGVYTIQNKIIEAIITTMTDSMCLIILWILKKK